ncbi:glycosyltransferase family 39 protein [Prochlorococcus sp. MIT 1303]|uniref:ArnT family glycosyltransferase n=1 Tax=Prochlorococcus sp. MIT 1303 TaxID=1723647 RepID=UPI0012E7272E|nr:4-amino-4-deoxy-L-arabinose transferase [Prochlorococcus sp. MIT 1303]
MFTPAAENNPSIRRAPLLGLLLLWLVACVLALVGLGDLPLRDFDEGIVARVAFELSQKQGPEALLPTLWDSPYLNKPPGLHWLIAAAIQLNNNGGSSFTGIPSNNVVRLVPALLSTLIIPLGGLVQWHLRPNDRTSCLATAAILLTLMPVVRHGRLAMLDGPQLSAMALLWLLVLTLDRSPMDRWRTLGAGLISSGMLLLKAPLLLPAAAAALIPVLWGGEFRRWWRWPLAGWFAAGLIPGLAWHLWHGLHRGTGALWLWGGDGAGRVLFDAGEGSDLGWKVPAIEMLEGGWPWLLLWPFAMAWAWRQRHSRWGKWALGTQAVLAIAILPLKTQLPWYSHPLWLPFALLCGAALAWLIHRKDLKNPPGAAVVKHVPYLWLSLGVSLVLFGLIGASGRVLTFYPYSGIALAAGVGWSIGGWLMLRPTHAKRKLGAISMVAGSVAALYLLMGSSLWLWELNENWPVEPVAQLAAEAKGAKVVLEGNDERPSLNWYAGQRISSLEAVPDAEWILTRNPQRISSMAQERQCKAAQSKEDWALLFCGPRTQ